MTDLPQSGRVEDGVHYLPVRIYFEDTDTSGIVYHARYLHFMERGRTEFLRCLDIPHSALMEGEDAAAFAVKSINIDYARPAVVDDALIVQSHVTDVKGSSCTLAQKIMRGDEALVSATLRVVVIGQNLRPRRIPKEMRRHFEAIMKTH